VLDLEPRIQDAFSPSRTEGLTRKWFWRMGRNNWLRSKVQRHQPLPGDNSRYRVRIRTGNSSTGAQSFTGCARRSEGAPSEAPAARSFRRCKSVVVYPIPIRVHFQNNGTFDINGFANFRNIIEILASNGLQSF
jgi:hypothetical protein